jgi:hypothetical protein
MKQLLIITADANDADYIHSQIEIENEADLERVSRILKVIKKARPENVLLAMSWLNWYRPENIYKDLLSADDIQWFDENFVPQGENGIHSITRAVLYEISNETRLF